MGGGLGGQKTAIAPPKSDLFSTLLVLAKCEIDHLTPLPPPSAYTVHLEEDQRRRMSETDTSGVIPPNGSAAPHKVS